ncbi:MAG TPA: helix-turn-helix domain-containing protein [Acidimicrobiia bacterium]|nr:helix-turn-helix domain-containing protein [Acidimicrobiia bacterium]
MASLEPQFPNTHQHPQRFDFPPVLTTALAAELLQVHAESLRKMVREGRIPCHRLAGGRGMRFLRDELLAWVAAQPGTTCDAREPGAPDAPVSRWAPAAPIEGR